jgi:queuosine precursor transporter
MKNGSDIESPITNKSMRLFLILGAIFVTNALIAEFIGVKIFSFEKSIGIDPFQISLFGLDTLSFNLSAGVLLWPVVFILTDVINEYYGKRGVKLLSFLAVGMISYAFIVFYLGIRLVPADFWPQSHISAALSEVEQNSIREKVGDYNYAFRLVFNQGLWIIIGSLVAFLVGQFLDVWVFHRIKRLTGEKMIWLRATGSTLISQLIDSYIVLFIAFYIGADWSLKLVLAIGIVNYFYKFVVAILMTPLIYLAHHWIDQYLGVDVAKRMKANAMADSTKLNF